MCKLKSYKCSLSAINKAEMPKTQEKDELYKKKTQEKDELSNTSFNTSQNITFQKSSYKI